MGETVSSNGHGGAKFCPGLDADRADLVVRKGFRRAIDSYSDFFENDRTPITGLEGYLRSRGIDRLLLVGLALDFCVNYSAVDGTRLGFDVRPRTRRGKCSASASPILLEWGIPRSV